MSANESLSREEARELATLISLLASDLLNHVTMDHPEGTTLEWGVLHDVVDRASRLRAILSPPPSLGSQKE